MTDYRAEHLAKAAHEAEMLMEAARLARASGYRPKRTS